MKRAALASLLSSPLDWNPPRNLVVWAAHNSADVVVGVEGDTFLAVFLADELEAMVADEYGGGAALPAFLMEKTECVWLVKGEA